MTWSQRKEIEIVNMLNPAQKTFSVFDIFNTSSPVIFTSKHTPRLLSSAARWRPGLYCVTPIGPRPVTHMMLSESSVNLYTWWWDLAVPSAACTLQPLQHPHVLSTRGTRSLFYSLQKGHVKRSYCGGDPLLVAGQAVSLLHDVSCTAWITQASEFWRPIGAPAYNSSFFL